jgi:hypothetical protein
VSQYCAKIDAIQRHADSATLAQTDAVAPAYSIEHDIANRIRLGERIARQCIPTQFAGGLNPFALVVGY